MSSKKKGSKKKKKEKQGRSMSLGAVAANKRTDERTVKFFQAACRGDRGALERLLNGGQVDMDALLVTGGSKFATALCAAVFNGHEKVVRLLLDRGANPSFAHSQELRDATRQQGIVCPCLGSPLMVSAIEGSLPLLQLLLEAKAELDARHPNGFNYTAFHFSCDQGHADCAEALVRAGCDTNALSQNGKTGRDLADAKGHKLVSERLDALGVSNPTVEVVDKPTATAPNDAAATNVTEASLAVLAEAVLSGAEPTSFLRSLSRAMHGWSLGSRGTNPDGSEKGFLPPEVARVFEYDGRCSVNGYLLAAALGSLDIEVIRGATHMLQSVGGQLMAYSETEPANVAVLQQFVEAGGYVALLELLADNRREQWMRPPRYCFQPKQSGGEYSPLELFQLSVSIILDTLFLFLADTSRYLPITSRLIKKSPYTREVVQLACDVMVCHDGWNGIAAEPNREAATLFLLQLRSAKTHMLPLS